MWLIIHLEPDSCPSKMDIIDINESAAMCFQQKAYIDQHYLDELLNRKDLQSTYSELVYACELMLDLRDN